MSKSTKDKPKDGNLKQPKIGGFFSKKPKESKKTDEKKRKVESPSSSMWTSFWTRGAFKDTEEYRNRYPGKKDHEKWNENYQFYMNEIPSKPDGDFIDDIHAKWYGDYKKLEFHHGYIQWLFPIRDTGMNWYAQELQLHEIEKLTENQQARERILKSYKMMLDFYGMVLKDETTGEIERADNWKDRFKHLNSSYHNYLRITRILKSLGEFNFEHLKAPFVRFILHEGLVEGTLKNLIDSCTKYWIGVLRNDDERESALDYYEELMEQQKKEKASGKKGAEADSAEPTIKVRTGVSRYVHKYDSDHDSDKDEDMAQYDNMDMLEDTLPFEKNLNSDEEGEKENDDNDNNSGTKKKGHLRKEHSMSDSDTEDFKTPDVGESQEAQYWAKNGKGIDGMEEEKNKEIRDFLMGETVERDQDKEKQSGNEEEKNAAVNEQKNKDKKDQSANEDICSDQIDDVISSKEKKKTVTKSEPKETSENGAKETAQEISEKANADTEVKQIAIDGTEIEDSQENQKCAVDNEEPMETGDDGNVNA